MNAHCALSAPVPGAFYLFALAVDCATCAGVVLPPSTPFSFLSHFRCMLQQSWRAGWLQSLQQVGRSVQIGACQSFWRCCSSCGVFCSCVMGNQCCPLQAASSSASSAGGDAKSSPAVSPRTDAPAPAVAGQASGGAPTENIYVIANISIALVGILLTFSLVGNHSSPCSTFQSCELTAIPCLLQGVYTLPKESKANAQGIVGRFVVISVCSQAGLKFA